jgi:antitoxin CptB
VRALSEEKIPLGKLRWRCHRGTKELDRILGHFLEEEYAHASPQIQWAFAQLLEMQDPDIYDWLMGAGAPVEVEFKELIAQLQISHRA